MKHVRHAWTNLASKDLIDLVGANVADGEKRIHEMYDWYFSRSMDGIKLKLGFASSLMAALFASFLKVEAKDAPTRDVVLFIVGTALLLTLVGSYKFVRLRRMNRDYTAALSLYYDLKTTQPIIGWFRSWGL